MEKRSCFPIVRYRDTKTVADVDVVASFVPVDGNLSDNEVAIGSVEEGLPPDLDLDFGKQEKEHVECLKVCHGDLTQYL